MSTTIRKFALPIAFLAIALPVGVGVVMAMGDREQAPTDSAFTPVTNGGVTHYERRAQPRWERVAALSGSGAATRQFAVDGRAIQWKTDWSCASGTFRMTVGRPSQGEKVLATSSCPDVGNETSTGTGAGMLRIAASGPWRVVVRQQVDTALQEPALTGMSATSALSRGHFHNVQKHGEGTVTLHRLASGRLALRFQNMYISPSPGLRLWLSTARDVTSTLQARQAHHVDAGAIRSTMGSYNQMLPPSVGADAIRSIVIWCPTVLIAFGAAPLTSG